MDSLALNATADATNESATNCPASFALIPRLENPEQNIKWLF